MASFFAFNCILHSAEDSREGICKGLDRNLSFHLSLIQSGISALCLDFSFSSFWMSFLCSVIHAERREDCNVHRVVISKTVC